METKTRMTGHSSRRSVVIHQAFIRPTLLLGAERELLIGSLLLSSTLAFVLDTSWGVLLSLVVAWISVVCLQRGAAKDPHFTRVYLRHARYSAYLDAAARIRPSTESPGLGGLR